MIVLFYQNEIPHSKWSQICGRNPAITESDDGKAVLELFSVYENGDPDLLKKVQGSSSLKYLENEVLKLVKSLPVPAKGAIHPSASHQDLRDEIEEEGFC
jgi:hypothetical protein